MPENINQNRKIKNQATINTLKFSKKEERRQPADPIRCRRYRFQSPHSSTSEPFGGTPARKNAF